MTRSRLATLLYGTGCFLLPVAILCAATFIDDIYPFGSLSFIEADLRFQYVDFFAWYRDALMGTVDWSYSTAQGLGNGTVAMVGYYLASPFNLLLPLFDESSIPLFCFIIILAKVGCIQVSTVFYLRKRFGLTRLWACALALGFTLSVWTITQLRNPMWLDGIILLPICAWGVCCLLRSGKWKLLALSYGACVLTNWYMGYMIGLFLYLYAPFEGLALAHEGIRASKGEWRKRALLFCGSMGLGIALSAVIFLPSVIAMMTTGTTIDTDEQSRQIQDLIAHKIPFLASVPFELLAGAAILAFFLIAGIIFFILRKQPLRKRVIIIAAFTLLVCLALCIAVPALQRTPLPDVLRGLVLGAWQDNTTPQLFGSFLLLVAALAFFCLRSISLELKTAAGLLLLLLLLSCWFFPFIFIWGGFRLPAGYYSRTGFLFIFMLLWCASFTLRAGMQAKSASRLLELLSNPAAMVTALVLVAIGTTIRAALIWQTIFGFIPYALFSDYSENAVVQAAELEQRDPGIYRVEKAYWKLGEESLNEGMSLGVNQLSSYTSTGNGNVMAFLTAIGCGDGEFFTYEASPSLAADSLLGVKYLSAAGAPPGYEDTGLSSITVTAPYYTLENVRFYENPFALSLAYGTPDTITSFEMPKGNRWECLNAFAQAAWGQSTDLYPNAGTVEDPELDMAAFEQMIADLKEHQFNFDEFGGSHISGTFNAAERQMLLMTIPNQDGWRVWVDGEEVVPQDVADGALMAIPVHAGENRVEMQFTTPGLYAGFAITILALLFLLCAWRFEAGRPCRQGCTSSAEAGLKYHEER